VRERRESSRVVAHSPMISMSSTGSAWLVKAMMFVVVVGVVSVGDGGWWMVDGGWLIYGGDSAGLSELFRRTKSPLIGGGWISFFGRADIYGQITTRPQNTSTWNWNLWIFKEKNTIRALK
jgi:hypothetical protein